jgi:hypothetical protein
MANCIGPDCFIRPVLIDGDLRGRSSSGSSEGLVISPSTRAQSGAASHLTRIVSGMRRHAFDGKASDEFGVPACPTHRHWSNEPSKAGRPTSEISANVLSPNKFVLPMRLLLSAQSGAFEMTKYAGWSPGGRFR